MKPESRARHVADNLKWSGINAAVTSLLPFVIRTLLIHRIGLEYSGVSNLFSSILQVLNIADFGIESAVTFYLYKPLAEEDYDTVKYLIDLVRKVYRVIGLVILGGGIAVMPFLPMLVLGKEYPEGLNIYGVFLIYLTDSAWAYLTTGYKSTLLRADQHLDMVSKAGCISASLMYVVQILGLVLFRSYYVYIGELLIGPVLNSVMLNYFANRRYKAVLEKADPSRSRLRGNSLFHAGMKSRIVSIFLAKLRNTSRNAFDSIVISSFLGLSLLAKYQNYYQIMLVPILILTILHNSMAPSFGNSIATESAENNYGVLKTYSFLLCGLSCVCVSCLLNLYQPFMTLWLGEEYLLPYDIVVILAVYFYLMGVSDINVVLKETTGIWQQERVIAVVEAVSNLVLNVLLVRRFGVEGVLIATIVTLLFINIPFEFWYIFRHYFRQHGVEYFLLELKYAATCLGLGFISWWICSRITIVGIAGLAVRLLVSVAVPGILFLVLYGRDREMKNMWRLVRAARK